MTWREHAYVRWKVESSTTCPYHETCGVRGKAVVVVAGERREARSLFAHEFRLRQRIVPETRPEDGYSHLPWFMSSHTCKHKVLSSSLANHQVNRVGAKGT